MTAPARDRGSSTATATTSAAGRRAGGRAGSGTTTSARTRTDSPRGTTAAPERPTTPRRGRNGSAERTGARRSGAAERAYARRAQRTGAPRADSGALRERLAQWHRSRTSFVLVLMALMAVGVAATLWLSTQAIADTWRLRELRENNTQLAERAERLQREVGQLRSPSSLARRAAALGMVPGGNAARLVVRDDGSVAVVGEPSEATAPPEAPPVAGAAQDGGDTDGAAGGGPDAASPGTEDRGAAGADTDDAADRGPDSGADHAAAG